jgi:hypothetical protein
VNNFVFEFARGLAFICRRCGLAGSRPLRWTVIANTAAGGFKIRKRVLTHSEGLATALKKSASLPVHRAEPAKSASGAENPFAEYGFCTTNAAGDAAMVTKELLREADSAMKRETADGETVLLEPQDFPAAIEVSPPVIPVLDTGVSR